MWGKIFNLLAKHVTTLVIGFFWLAVVLTNYDLGTWLTGWDNLHPEFNPLQDLWRSFNSVWQEYQGIGLLGGMAHSSDLVRQLIILPMVLILPDSLVRYSLLFIMLLLGAVGAKHLFYQIFSRAGVPAIWLEVAATVAGLFYLLNLGTVQNFYVAFEPFYWFYGTLPWLLYFLLRAWRFPCLMNYLIFLVISFMATPAYYIQTNFVVYGVMLIAFTGGYLFEEIKKGLKHLVLATSNILITGMIVFLANAFWLLPMIYFVFSGGSEVTIQSHINQVATPEVILENRAFSNPIDILLLRGYWWGYDDYDGKTMTHEPILKAWIDYPLTLPVAMIFILFLIMGILQCLFFSTQKNVRVLMWSLVALVFLLLTNSLNIPLLSQIFRSPFTKTVAPLSLIYSLLVGAGILYGREIIFANRALERKTKKYAPLMALAGFSLLILVYAWPAFEGNFIYYQLRNRIPDAYFRLFDFFDKQPSQARMALIPADTIYGWQFYRWGSYRGIGFYWFGLKQPILARSFDVWSKENENFYQELYHVRLQNNATDFIKVLKKYQVRYLLFDESIYQATKNYDFSPVWAALVKKTPECLLVFQEDFLSVYDCDTTMTSFVRAPETIFATTTTANDHFFDSAYATGGDYITPMEKGDLPIITWPFNYLYQHELSPLNVAMRSLTDSLTQITFQADLPKVNTVYKELYVPALPREVPLSFLFTTAIEDGKLIFTLSPNFTLNLNTTKQEVFPNLKLTAALPTVGEEFYFDFGTTKTKFKLGTTGVPQVITLTNFSSNQTWHYFATQSATVQADGNIIASRASTYDVEVPLAAWQPFFQDYPLALTQDVSSLSVVVTTQAHTMIDSQPHPKQNCDVLGRGEVQKTVQNGELIYQASGKGNFCNSFYSPDINTNLNSYLVEITADNQRGWPLSYYFYDAQSEATIWENLFYAAYDRRLFSFPQNRVSTNDKAAFTFHIMNRSLSGERVENSLSLPSFYLIPTAWLTNLQLREKGAMTLRLGQDNNLQVLSSSKLGTSHYQVVVQKLSAETAVLQLAQGYHASWQARLNGKVLPHVKVNNWANGWVMRGEQCVAEPCTIKISFGPQWFGWGGLMMTGVLVLLAIFAFFYLKPSSAACQNNFIFGSLKTNIKKILVGK